MSENASDRELILGNKQLLAIFFVGALLCGVFFAVGYVVGGNSAKATGPIVADSSTAVPVEGKRDEPAPFTPVSDTTPATSTAGTSETAGMAAESKMSDDPAAAGSIPSSSATAQAATPSAPPPSQNTSTVKPAPAPAASGPMPLSVPEKGTSYVQVAAQARPAAESTARTLARAGWPTILAASPRPEWVEVLVGPYRDGVALADAKRKLVELGFSQAFVHKQQ